MLEVTHRGGIILQVGVVVITLGYQSLAKIGLESKGVLGRLPRFVPERFRSLQGNSDIADRIDVRQERPRKREFRVQAHSFSQMLLPAKRVGG